MAMSTAQGVNGTVEFDGQFVTIKREGALARMSQGRGEKRIAVRQITAVQMKPPGVMTNGFIQFTIGGGVERQAAKGSRTINAASDENSVIFKKSQQADFEAVRAEIEQAIASGGAPAATAPDLADQLGKLAALRDQGVLTDAEFESKKADLLARM